MNVSLLDPVLWWLLPAACLHCAAPLPRGRAPLGLCHACRRRLEPHPADACPLCGRALAGGPATVCGRCRARPPSLDLLVVGWRYLPPLPAVVRGLKFARLDYLGGHLGEALHAEVGPRLPAVDGVVPVPLHWRRRLARGYNQSALIARALAGRLGLPLVPALARARATPPQTALGRERRLANPRRAFRPRRRRTVAGRSLLLVDDVVTTGATLDAAARELKRAGGGDGDGASQQGSSDNKAYNVGPQG